MTDHIAVVSDLHGGSKVALSVAGFMLDGDTPLVPNAAHRWLWECWENTLDRLHKLKRRGDTLTVILNGDLVEGDLKMRTFGVHTRNHVRVRKMVTEILEPLYKIADKCIFVAGTPSHVGVDGSIEEALADDCTIAVPNPENGRKLWTHAKLEVQGVRIAVQHHGPARSNAKMRRKAADDLAEQLIINAAKCGSKLSHLSIYSHGHFFIDTESRYPVRVIFTPAWQLAPDYVYYKPVQEVSDIGSIVVSIKDGAYECHPILYPLAAERYQPLTDLQPIKP